MPHYTMPARKHTAFLLTDRMFIPTFVSGKLNGTTTSLWMRTRPNPHAPMHFQSQLHPSRHQTLENQVLIINEILIINVLINDRFVTRAAPSSEAGDMRMKRRSGVCHVKIVRSSIVHRHLRTPTMFICKTHDFIDGIAPHDSYINSVSDC